MFNTENSKNKISTLTINLQNLSIKVHNISIYLYIESKPMTENRKDG